MFRTPSLKVLYLGMTMHFTIDQRGFDLKDLGETVFTTKTRRHKEQQMHNAKHFV